MCFPFSSGKGEHINNLTPTHFRDNPTKLFMFIVFFLPRIFCGEFWRSRLKFSSEFWALRVSWVAKFKGDRNSENSRRLEIIRNVDFKKHPARKEWTRSRQCRPKVPGRFAFPSVWNPGICSISQFGKNIVRQFSWDCPGAFLGNQGRKNHDSHRRDRIWRDFLHWIFRYFLQILGGLTKLHINTGEKAKNPVESLQWRRRPEIADESVPCRGRTCPDLGKHWADPGNRHSLLDSFGESSTPNMGPDDVSTVQWKWSPPGPGSLKALLLFTLFNKKYKTRERKGYERGTARNFLHSFPLSGTAVVQSYWATRQIPDIQVGQK